MHAWQREAEVATRPSDRDTANAMALRRLCEADPVLLDVRPAVDVPPGMTSETVLTSGPAMAWHDYTGGQRDAIIGGALFEGLADYSAQAEAMLASGEITIGGCHDYGAVGSLAGIYTASIAGRPGALPAGKDAADATIAAGA